MNNNAYHICQTLQARGFIALLVGGCVRDRIVGVVPKDYDVVTNALPTQVMDILSSTGYSLNEVGAAFGVVVAHSPASGDDVEVATFRKECGYSDSAHPDRIEFITSGDVNECVEQDSARRDLRFNAIYEDPLISPVYPVLIYRDVRGIYDPQGGIEDLKNRRVRFIGNTLDRITEDPIRILRFVRFCARFGCEPDSKAVATIKENCDLITHVSPERIGSEMTNILTSPNAGDSLLLLVQMRVTHNIHEIDALYRAHGQQFAEYHPEGNVLAHTAFMLNGLRNPSPELAWGVLLHDIGKPMTFDIKNDTYGDEIPLSDDPDIDWFIMTEFWKITNRGHAAVGADMSEVILRRLKFSNDFIDDVCALVRYHMDFAQVQDMKLSTVKKMLARPTIEDEIELHRVDCKYSTGDLSNWEWIIHTRDTMPPEVVEPEWFITGFDIIAQGVAPGPELGTILAEMHDRQLEDEFSNRETALNCLEKICRDRCLPRSGLGSGRA